MDCTNNNLVVNLVTIVKKWAFACTTIHQLL